MWEYKYKPQVLHIYSRITDEITQIKGTIFFSAEITSVSAQQTSHNNKHKIEKVNFLYVHWKSNKICAEKNKEMSISIAQVQSSPCIKNKTMGIFNQRHLRKLKFDWIILYNNVKTEESPSHIISNFNFKRYRWSKVPFVFTWATLRLGDRFEILILRIDCMLDRFS